MPLMRFRLRTLLIVLAIGPPVLAFVFFHRQIFAALTGQTANIVVPIFLAYAVLTLPFWIAVKILER